jgi:hypothetical protein
MENSRSQVQLWPKRAGVNLAAILHMAATFLLGARHALNYLWDSYRLVAPAN